ncbi:response regulator, partial [Vibrio sinaloensis]
DSLRIQQVLTNLVGNSIKFTEHGNIDISVEMRSQKEDVVELQFMVRDTGIGISERQQAQLFQAFSQADASISRRYGGTGLGLVITQKLVSQMGGEISLTSRLHQGSTFWFTLRLHSTDMPVTEMVDTDSLKQRSLLLVEPNMQAASVTQQQLVQAGLVVTYRSALPEDAEQFDYVLLNLAPNREHETSAVEQQVEHALRCAPHVVVGVPSTALALSDDLIQSYPIHCITKPLSRKRLLQTLSANQDNLPVIEPEVVVQDETLPLTVMAVDDNPANLKLISALLQERVEHVITCTNGLDAVQQAQERHFDIILMDIQMPHMDGVTACEEIKKTQLNANTPVIAVTAHAMSGERDRLLKAGMDDYLTKPIEEHVLQQVLMHWSPQTTDAQIEKLDLSAQPDPFEPTTSTTSTHSNMIIDWQAALKQSANKEDLAKDMLQMLVDSIPEVVDIVDNALEEESIDTELLIHHVHKLHGSSSYCGVPRLKTVCATIEKALRSGTQIEDLEPELLELQDEMEKVVASAQPYLKK